MPTSAKRTHSFDWREMSLRTRSMIESGCCAARVPLLYRCLPPLFSTMLALLTAGRRTITTDLIGLTLLLSLLLLAALALPLSVAAAAEEPADVEAAMNSLPFDTIRSLDG